MYARTPARETLLLPQMRSKRIFFCTIAFRASTPNLPSSGILRSCSLPRVGYAIVAKRDFGQDLRFLRDAREIRKNANIGLCACLSSVIVQSFARRRASRGEEIGFARACSRVQFFDVFLVTSTTLYVFSNYVEYVYSITVGRVLFYLRRYSSCYDSLVPY